MQEAEHGENIAAMFNRISRRYDLLNRLLSGFQDMRWRRRAVKMMGDLKYKTALDLCCGTGDFLHIFRKYWKNDINLIGIDFAAEMVRLGHRRFEQQSDSKILLMQGDALSLPLVSNSIAAVTIGFGIRNIKDRPTALKEILRVLDHGGRLAIIEPAIPKNPLIGIPFTFYFKYIMPLIGGLLSGNYKAYKYLDDSVLAFPPPDKFVALMEKCGFTNCRKYPQFLGMAMIYYGEKTA